MRHEMLITPLNGSFDASLNQFAVWEKGVYQVRQTPTIYCKDPDESWFRLKSTDVSPYIEPVLYGVRGGDRVAVKFEALSAQGSGSVAVDVFQLTLEYERILLVTSELPANSLDTYFRDYSIPCLLKLDPDSLGIVLRIRPVGSGTEVILRHVTIEVDTANGNFAPQTQVVRYESVGDYLDCIHTYSLTDVDEAYHSLYQLFSSGQIEFPDEDTVAFGGTGDGFRGMMAMLPGNRYQTPVAAYFEYQADEEPGVSVNVRGLDSFGKVLGTDEHQIDSAGEWTQSAVYFDGADWVGARKILMDVGSRAPLRLRNVRFVVPRFDDEPKRNPNRLEDLYSDLGTRLRGLRS